MVAEQGRLTPLEKLEVILELSVSAKNSVPYEDAKMALEYLKEHGRIHGS